MRYTEADIESFANSENFFSLTFTLEDKFGDQWIDQRDPAKKTE